MSDVSSQPQQLQSSAFLLASLPFDAFDFMRCKAGLDRKKATMKSTAIHVIQ